MLQEWLGRTTEDVSHNGRVAGLRYELGPLQYKANVTAAPPRHAVF